VDVLHDQVVPFVLPAEVVDRSDVRVIEASHEAGLVEEHAHELGVTVQVTVDALDDDVLGKTRHSVVAGQVDLSHPADGEPLDESELREFGARAGHALVARSPGRERPSTLTRSGDCPIIGVAQVPDNMASPRPSGLDG